MHPFMDQMVAMRDISDTRTHFAPSIRCFLISGVNAATSAGDIKFDPPPPTMLLSATHSSVYQQAENIMR